MILAHYGGIDEIAIFVVPAVAAIVLLRWAEKKAKRRSGTGGGTDDGSTG